MVTLWYVSQELTVLILLQQSLWEVEDQIKTMQLDHALQLEMAASQVAEHSSLGWSAVPEAWHEHHLQYLAVAGAYALFPPGGKQFGRAISYESPEQ